MKPLISISFKRFIITLVIVVLALNAISFVGRTVEYFLGIKETTALVRLFHIGEEGNITTWYSALSLLFCAILLAIIGYAKKETADPFTRHWNVLALIFLYISLDEAASIHEITMRPLQTMFNASGIFYFGWVIIAIPLVLLFSVMYLKFLLHLPRTFRRLFIIAGVLFVTGALGLELVEGYFYSQELTRWGPIVPLLTTAEEFLEMVGIVVFIYALISYLKQFMKMTEIRFNFI